MRRALPGGAAIALLLTCAACATAPVPKAPTPHVSDRWVAPLPHAGLPADLREWWRQFDDPRIAELIDLAQHDSPTLEQAAARIRQTRAALRQVGAARLPAVAGNAQAQRGYSSTSFPSGSQTLETLTTDASWELDLFGRVRASVAAADARAQQNEFQWHDARVSLAAEVATEYVALRACEALVVVYEQDVASQTHTAELTRTKVRAGFETPANGALAGASAADAETRLISQKADCDISLKTLVWLTGLAEPDLRGRLAPAAAQLPHPAQFDIAEVPAEVLAQRPDLAAAERELAAAVADVDVAEADRYPRITLSGSVGYGYSKLSGLGGTDGKSWSFGPAINLPLFDAGKRRAAAEEARGRYDEAAAKYRANAKRAVREVEEALVRLDSASRREDGARRAAEGYQEFFTAAEKRWRVGTGSLLDIEEARRNALTANATLIQVRRDRVAAWITLYKAVGGGWSATGAAAGATPEQKG